MPRAPRLASLSCALGLSAAVAQDAEPPARGPDLAAASNFGHGWSEATFDAAVELPVLDFRDTIDWPAVEERPGDHAFDEPTTSYPAWIEAVGGRMSLTVNWGNPLYDDGDTPHTPGAREAFAAFVAAALDAHPAIEAVEVGNEFNGDNFVRGAILEAPRAERAAHHFRLLRDVHEAVKARHPDVAVLGGAAHSIPGGYLWPLLELGAADYMDALVLHPYTTPPEQLARQIGVLRREPSARALALQVTEFGEQDPEAAPGYLLRMYCAMALSGVERAAWYPLNDRGDGHVPLIDPATGAPTGAGLAFALAEQRLAGRPVEDASPDPFTYACRFGEGALLVWGEPRGLAVPAGVEALDATGRPLDAAAPSLSMEAPILLLSEGRLEWGAEVALEPQPIVADSFHQFAYPEPGETFAASDPFQRFARRGEEEIALGTMPGQEAPGTLWTPYLGTRHLRPARLSADALVPGGGGDRPPVEIVHRYVADRDRALAVDAHWTLGERSRDGVEVAVRLEGETLDAATVAEEHRTSLPRVEMREGDALEFVVGPGGDAKGDVTGYRIVLREAR